jgi:hypothetical protein
MTSVQNNSGGVEVAFPLTPALSLRERGIPAPSQRMPNDWIRECRGRKFSSILSLSPLPKGEGQGEGEVRVKSNLNNLMPGRRAGAAASWSAPVLWRFSRRGQKAASTLRRDREDCRSPKPREISGAAFAGARVCDPQELRRSENVRINVNGLDNLSIPAGHRPALRTKAARN